MRRSSAAKKSHQRDAASKLAQREPSVIELARELDNEAEAMNIRPNLSEVVARNVN